MITHVFFVVIRLSARHLLYSYLNSFIGPCCTHVLIRSRLSARLMRSTIAYPCTHVLIHLSAPHT